GEWNGRNRLQLSGQACGRNDRNLSAAADGESTEEIAGEPVRGGDGSECAGGDSRRFEAMEKSGANGVGNEGCAFQCGMGGVAGPNVARFARGATLTWSKPVFPRGVSG